MCYVLRYEYKILAINPGGNRPPESKGMDGIPEMLYCGPGRVAISSLRELRNESFWCLKIM
jgi:hypothetical protein